MLRAITGKRNGSRSGEEKDSYMKKTEPQGKRMSRKATITTGSFFCVCKGEKKERL